MFEIFCCDESEKILEELGEFADHDLERIKELARPCGVFVNPFLTKKKISPVVGGTCSKDAKNGSDTDYISKTSDVTLPAEQSSNLLQSHKSTIARLEGQQSLTMIERQELWLAKKAVKADTKLKDAADLEAASVKAAPDVGQSRRSFMKTQSYLKETLASKEKKSCHPLWNITNQEKNKKKQNKIRKRSSARKKSRAGVGSILSEDSENMNANVRREMAKLVEAASQTHDGLEDDDDASSEDDLSENIVINKSDAEQDPIKYPSAMDEAKIVTEEINFFTKIDNEQHRGSIHVRDNREFQVSSMYRKRDTGSGEGSAIALLVGRTEAPPHTEKVIEVIFDTEKISEREALKWWDLHRFRMESPSKQQNRTDMDINT